MVLGLPLLIPVARRLLRAMPTIVNPYLIARSLAMSARRRQVSTWTEDDLAAYESKMAMTATLKALPHSRKPSPPAQSSPAPVPSPARSAPSARRGPATRQATPAKPSSSPISPVDTELQATLRAFLGSAGKTSPVASATSTLSAARPAKRRGLGTKPIKDSLATADIKVISNAKVFAVWFTGARAFTVNELIALYQYRKYETFGYKKLWQNLIQRAFNQAKAQGFTLPYFTHDTRLTLYRRGTRLVDLDSLPAMFKYAIDSFKKSHLIAEDNPNVITKLIPFQEQGKPVIALRLEQLTPISKPAMDFPSLWLSPNQLDLD